MTPNPAGATAAGTGERLGLLDLARFIAALSIVLFHYVGRSSPAWSEPATKVFPTLQPSAQYGALGVLLFFMISGFVILMSAYGRDVRGFLAARLGRLLPAYWFAVLATSALLILVHRLLGEGEWSALGVSAVAANLTMMQTALGVPHLSGVFWTLWVELKFYALIAVLIAIGLNRTRVLVLAVSWPLIGALAQVTEQRMLVELLTPNYAPYFAVGMMLYLIRSEGPCTATVAVAVLNVLLAMGLSPRVVDFYADAAGVRLSPTIVALAVPIMATLVLAITNGPLSRVHWRWLTVLGAMTYPLYLLHEMFGWYVIRALTPVASPIVAASVAGLLMCCVAYTVHRLVERPLGPQVTSMLRNVGRRSDARVGSARSSLPNSPTRGSSSGRGPV